MTTTTDLDRAINAVDHAIEPLRDDDLEPAELSAVVGALRELFWHTTTLTTVLAGVYDQQHGLGHDDGHDPDGAAAAIGVGLRTVAGHLAAMDYTLADAHNTAAKLHRC
jgi:hypothetical protein